MAAHQLSRRRLLLSSTSLAAGVSAIGVSTMTNAGETPEGRPSHLGFREQLLECLGGPWPEPVDLKPRARSSATGSRPSVRRTVFSLSDRKGRQTHSSSCL